MSKNNRDEKVNHPPHYNALPAKCACGKTIECISVVRHMSFNLGNVVKYIWRADEKGAPLEDLKKALWYLNDEIAMREKNTNKVAANIRREAIWQSSYGHLAEHIQMKDKATRGGNGA